MQPSEVTVEVENENETNMEHEKQDKVIASGQKALLDFMRAAGNPMTGIESREIWTDLCWTANGYSFPLFQDAFFDLSHRIFPKACSVESTETETKKVGSVESTETPLPSPKPNIEELEGSGRGEDEVEPRDSQCDEEDAGKSQKVTGITEEDIASLSDAQLVYFAKELAEGIKDSYSVRQQNDNTELKFLTCSLGFVWMTVASLIIACHYFPDNPKLGDLSWDASKRTLWEAFMMFAVEFVWECFLSWLVLRYNVKINYTRKLGNLLKVPKYFVVDLSESVTATALSMTLAFVINFTIFSLISYRKFRERFPFCAYFLLSQDRREDRPDTLIFNGVEDIMRFGIYFPFKLLVVDLVGKPALIFIPIGVNNIGDGLAEPVGVAFGKHKYTVTSIYHSTYDKRIGRLLNELYLHCAYS